MTSRKLYALAARFEVGAQNGEHVFTPTMQRAMAAMLYDLAAQVDHLERQVVPANARHTGEGDNVVRLKPAAMPVQPVIGGAA